MNEGKVSGENISRMGMLHFKMISFLTRKLFSGFMTVILTSPLFGILAIARFERCFFSEHVFYADDPDRKKYIYDLPSKSGFVILKDQWICSVAKSDHARKNTGRVLTEIH